MASPSATESPARDEARAYILDYLDNARDGAFILGEDMRLRALNGTLADWMGSKSSVKNLSILTGLIGLSSSVDLFVHKSEVALAGTAVRFDCLIRPLGGLPRWVEFTLNRIPRNRADAELLGVARDISVQRQEMSRLRQMAIYDEVTGVLNRREFTRRLQAMKSEGCEEHSLLFIDLDQFKVVNATCGHLAGDELLCRLAGTIRDVLPADPVFGRIGADEFALLLHTRSIDQAHDTALAIRDAIGRIHFSCEGRHIDIGVGIGIAPLQSGEASADCVLSAATSACQVAKQKGRNRIHVHSGSMECSNLQRESSWVSRITDAFENDRLELYYQNILPIGSKYGCYDHREILLRLIDEDGRRIEPREFLPAAEKYHLMPLLDRWVIRTLFSRNGELWRNAFQLLDTLQGITMPLCCINLSGASLNDDYFPEFLRDQIQLHRIPPQTVCFEITETVAVTHLDKVSQLMGELKNLGFRFALDDFGSGMSSFAYLKSLPVDFLKIDGSLVRDIDESKTDFCMVEAIHRIAKEMGIKTIAEFVRDETMIEKLRMIGVDFVQGHGIHHPERLH